MTDSEWEQEKWYEKSRRQEMWILIMGMTGMWLCGIICGLLLAHFLITYGPRAGLQ